VAFLIGDPAAEDADGLARVLPSIFKGLASAPRLIAVASAAGGLAVRSSSQQR